MQLVITAAIPGWVNSWSQGSVVNVDDVTGAQLIAEGLASADEASTVVAETDSVEPAPLS